MGWVTTFFIVSLLIFGGVVLIAADKEIETEKRLMKQCLDDGIAEYQCYSMIKNKRDSSVLIMPPGGR